MPSLLGHTISGIALAKISSKTSSRKIILLSVFCAVIPDVDVLMFIFGIPYADPLGHRGFSHSILFALLLGFVVTTLFFNGLNYSSKKKISLLLLFFGCSLSHGLLDAMTDGGLGVGFFIPFNSSRYFFSFRPIKVSPLSLTDFFADRGLWVLISEVLWIGIPSLILIAVRRVINRIV